MARNHTKRNTTPAQTTEAAPQHTTLAEAIAQQADEEGKTEEEVLAELAAPSDDEAPVRKPREPGTSNLATTIARFRRNYAVALAPSGKKTANNGDWIATTLLLVPQPKLEAFVRVRFDRVYDGSNGRAALNPGHRRMCCGNLVRAAIKKNEGDVTEWLLSFLPAETIAELADAANAE